ncbi:response regulator [Chromobacterium piscinae]|uniref:response regulator n=1 Tax=Chromobacterium piscinae TaxID=686831 RepID=UPI001E41B763|nr:response regulator [Chromobacterium piscinae]MCD5327411.1 response regulator [Chromobacterium piscinae]
MEKHRMLVIDDDPIVSQVMQMLFETELELTCKITGEEGLKAVAEEKPEIVLLDIEMEGMDGYEACRRIRQLDLPLQPYVIFVSAHSDPVKRLAAYSVGGEDFVSKPLQPQELVRKVEQALGYRREIHELKSQARGAMSVAMSAMTDSSALGICLQYFRRLFQAGDSGQLMRTTLDALKEFGLDASVQFRDNGEVKTLSSESGNSQLESLLLQDLSAERQHIVCYDSRCAFNYGPVSLLINNMPVYDIERCGKLKDYLALMAEGAAERASAMIQDGVAAGLGQTGTALAAIIESQRAGQADARALVGAMRARMEDMLGNQPLAASLLALVDETRDSLDGLQLRQMRELEALGRRLRDVALRE